MSSQQNPMGRPIVFGEALFDVFPDGKEILGGAPLNVAWHLEAFGYHPLLISRVGTDPRGALARETMERWGMDTKGLQVDPTYPTGVVHISSGNSGPRFRTEVNQAYDHIAIDEIPQDLNNHASSLLLHGTLALRSSPSHKTLATLKEKLGIPIFVDLNLRNPWWSPSLVRETLKSTRWLKVNEHELKVISKTGAWTNDQYTKLAAQLMEQYKNIELLFVTLGAKGAFAARNGKTFYEKSVPIPPTALKDTVGGGDAFTAVAIIGVLRAWNINALLQRANQFAGAICRIPGATTTNRNLYQAHLKTWADQ